MLPHPSRRRLPPGEVQRLRGAAAGPLEVLVPAERLAQHPHAVLLPFILEPASVGVQLQQPVFVGVGLDD